MAYDGPSVVDFSQLRGPGPLAHAMDPIVAALDDLAARHHQEKMQREREEALNKRAAVDDQLNREKFEANRFEHNTSRRADTEVQVRAALDAGEYDKAKAIASGYQEMGAGNTVSRGLPGFDLKRPDPGPAPEAPPPPEAVPYGPQATPEEVRRAAEIRGQQDGVGGDKAAVQMQLAEGARFAGARDAGQEEGPAPSPEDSQRAALIRQEQASFEPPAPVDDSAAQADAQDFASAQGGEKVQAGNQLIPAQYLETVMAHDRDMGMWRDRANAAPEATVAGAHYDVRGSHDAAVRRRNETAAETRAAFNGKMDPKYVDLISAITATGAAPDKAAAAAAGQMEKDQARAFRAQQDQTYKAPWQEAEAGKTKRAIIGANSRVQAAGTARPASPMAEQALGLRERSERSKNLRQDVKAFQQTWNAKTTQEAAQEFPNIEKMLTSGNGKLQEQGLITMMRLAQKDNRFSDADAKMAMKTGAGWLDQAESWLNRGATGEIGQDVIAKAAAAARTLNGFYQQKAQAMHEEAKSFVEQPDFYDPKEAAQLLDRQIGSKFSKKDAARAPAAADPRIDEILKALQE